jgi:16S rRNA processing protein RimM
MSRKKNQAFSLTDIKTQELTRMKIYAILYPMNNNNKYIKIAKLTKPQGLKGQLRALPLCDYPEKLNEFKSFYLGEAHTPTKIWLDEIRKGFVVLTLEDIDNVVTAETFVGQFLYVLREEFELPENSWFISDLIGLTVVDVDTGHTYGKLTEILQNAPKDVYVVNTSEGGQVMFPAIPEVLIDVNLTESKISIRPLKGLFDN